jgi:hypothetical protein
LWRLRHFSRGRFVLEKNSSQHHRRRPKALQNIEKANDLVADPLGFGGPGARDYQP